MTLEQALLTAIASVTTALVFVCKILWKRSDQCEADRRELRDEIEKLGVAHGVATGTLAVMQRCPMQTCPFRGPQPPPVAPVPVNPPV